MTSIYDYVKELPHEAVNSLYTNPWCSLAVFQSLDALSQQVILRMLNIKAPLTVDFMYGWMSTSSEAKATLTSSIDKLVALRIIGTRSTPASGVFRAVGREGDVEISDANSAFSLSSAFRSSLAAAIAAEEEVPWEAKTSSMPPLAVSPRIEEVEDWAAARWNSILHYLVGSEDAPEPEPRQVELLVSTGLLAIGSGTEDSAFEGPDPAASKMKFEDILATGGGAVHVTRSGYEFLMQDTSVQLWTFMNEYLRTAEYRGMNKVDILAFFFELGFCRLGDGCAVAALTPTQCHLLKDFASFGLIHLPPRQPVRLTGEHKRRIAEEEAATGRKVDLRRFFPTSLAIVLTQPTTTSDTIQAIKTRAMRAASSVGGGRQEEAPTSLSFANKDPHKLYLVVEKNFKVYAYTSVDLHLALLALFAHVELRLPDLVVATLTRKSVLRAMEKGITASLIRHFLEVHAHPVLVASGVPVPQNVGDQLVLWEQERHRIQDQKDIVMLTDFPPRLFQDCLTFLSTKGLLVHYSDGDKKMLFVKSSDFDAVKRWLGGERGA